jgi:serine/threonine-protein kinase
MPDVTALPQPGDIFAGKYLIERLIGSGKTCLVFGARHHVTGKLFAIRWLLPTEEATRHDAVIEEEEREGDDDEESVSDAEEFLSDDAHDAGRPSSEHQVVGHFRHPNVLEVYDVGEEAGSLYTVMDWAEGEALDARLLRTGPLPIAEACRLLIPCMRGMHAAHAAGIVHRDLKPSNIFVYHATPSAPETVKVLDFEVASSAPVGEGAAAIVAHTGDLARQPYYRAPEQLGGLPTDHRVDVYAFGAMLYEVLSGRPPFAPTRADRPVSEISSAYSLSLQHGAQHLPRGADAIVARAMARDVEQRFQSLGELADALEAYEKRTSTAVLTHSTRFVADPTPRRAARPSVAPTPTPYATESVRDVHDPAGLPYTPAAQPPQMSLYVAGALLLIALVLAGRFLLTRESEVVATFDASTNPEVAAIELAADAPPAAAPQSAAPPADLPFGRTEREPAGPDPQLAAASSALEATLKMLQNQDVPAGPGQPALIPVPRNGANAAEGGEAVRLPLKGFEPKKPAAAKPVVSPKSAPTPNKAEAPRARAARPVAPARRPSAQPNLQLMPAAEPTEPREPKPRREPVVERDPLDMNLL